MLRANTNVFSYAEIGSEISGVPWLQVRCEVDVILVLVDRLPSEAVAIFDAWPEMHSPWQIGRSPKEEAVWNFSRSVGSDLRSHNRERKVSQVGGCVSYISGGILSHVREEKLP